MLGKTCSHDFMYQQIVLYSLQVCDPILENGAYCGIYDFELEQTKDNKFTHCRNSFYCINMFYKEIPFV